MRKEVTKVICDYCHIPLLIDQPFNTNEVLQDWIEIHIRNKTIAGKCVLDFCSKSCAINHLTKSLQNDKKEEMKANEKETHL